MITEKEIIEILDKQLKWKESIKAVKKEMKNVFTATEACMLEERKKQMKRVIEDIAKQIISKLPKLELIFNNKLENKDDAINLLITTKWRLSKIKWRKHKNIKIYVEIVDENKNK